MKVRHQTRLMTRRQKQTASYFCRVAACAVLFVNLPIGPWWNLARFPILLLAIWIMGQLYRVTFGIPDRREE